MQKFNIPHTDGNGNNIKYIAIGICDHHFQHHEHRLGNRNRAVVIPWSRKFVQMTTQMPLCVLTMHMTISTTCTTMLDMHNNIVDPEHTRNVWHPPLFIYLIYLWKCEMSQEKNWTLPYQMVFPHPTIGGEKPSSGDPTYGRECCNDGAQ